MSVEFIDKGKAEEIARAFAQRRFEGSQITIAATERTEVAGIPVYEVVGDSETPTVKLSFTVQIDAKTGKVFGLHLFHGLQGYQRSTDGFYLVKTG
ncbi:MAG: hypothetical protein EFT35_05935 [Methanophagales archaeon ANME-1-THS]|nr:MAG: hypothetical protein EFT35_05935 [Methanophagales archaeon ANME-1-THS]